MAEPIAYVDIQLEVHSDCESCMMKTIGVLSSVRGVYGLNWDSKQQLVYVTAEVDPSVLLKEIMRGGVHAKIVNVKLKHPQLHKSRAYYDNNNYNCNNYGVVSSSYGTSYGPYYGSTSSYGPYYGSTSRYQPSYYRSRSSAEYPYYGTSHVPNAPGMIDNPVYSTGYDYTAPLPPAANVPSYPPQEYNPYSNNYGGMSYCSIM